MILCCLIHLFAPSYLFTELDSQLWGKSNFVWSFGIASQCDLGLDQSPEDYFKLKPSFDSSVYEKIKTGDLVWVRSRFLSKFYHQVLPKVSSRFVLVVTDGDESFPTENGLSNKEIRDLLNHERIAHIFAQNFDSKSVDGENQSKVTHLPLGIDFHTIAYKKPNKGWGEERASPREQEKVLVDTLKSFKPTYLRKKRIFVDFHHSDSIRNGDRKRYIELGEDRTSIFEQIQKTGLVDSSDRMNRSALWKTKGEYAFSVSPHGNGLDCHRTWEDLVLGCIVIVKSSALDPMYAGLPVVIVQDWSEIHEQNLNRWLAQYGDALTNAKYRERLTNDYWFQKMQEKSKECFE